MPDDALDDIFRPFYRVDEERDRESGGGGLGLAITARAVRLHGGGVSAQAGALRHRTQRARPLNLHD